MSNKIKPPQNIIDFFEALGLKYKVVTDSIYTDKRDAPVHYFQSDDADGFKICSTILAEDAIKIYDRIHQTNVEIAFGRRCSKGHLMPLEASICKECSKIRSKQVVASRKAKV
jgi:hypothetical protein